MAHPTSGYRNAAGKRVPGTTTIIGRFKDSGGLLQWAFQQGQAAERGEISSLYDKRDKAADIGTLAHSMVEFSINGANKDAAIKMAQEAHKASDEDAMKAASAFDAYLMWESMTKLKIVEQETQLVSELYQFGGCPDAIGEINGELCLLDWKTSTGVYPDYMIQLAAYNQLWIENFPDRPLKGFHLCRFAKDYPDFSHHYWGELDQAWEQFKLYRIAYDIDKELKKRCK